MRDLNAFELALVSGAGCSPCPPSPCPPSTPTKKTKNNNGYGNGPESGPAPGRSGEKNPTLVGQNAGNHPKWGLTGR
jgi:hypothetical protein